MKLIPLDAVLAEIEKLKDEAIDLEDKSRWFLSAALKNRINSLEVKEVDLEKELKEDWLFADKTEVDCLESMCLTEDMFVSLAKKYFELGMRANNPITASDRGMAEEIIINLKRVEQDYHINLTREMEWLRNQAQKGK